MPRETMTPRERWLAVLTRKTPDRVPMDYWATQEVTERLMAHLGCADQWEVFARLHIDAELRVAPRYAGPPLPPGVDVFGCIHRDVDYGHGVYAECVSNPLAAFRSVEQIEQGYTWPDPDWWDYSGIAAEVRAHETYPVRGGVSEPLLTYKKLRGEEQAFIDLAENPEIVDYCLGRLFDLAYTEAIRIFEQVPGQVMVTYVAEDMGAQRGLMFSLEHIRRYLLPGMRRMIDLAHSAGAFAFHHNDGAIRAVIPDMIALGIDALNPIQWRCRGMDREGLKRDFGARLIFHGGVDNQLTLPFGSPAEVQAEVLDNLRILGAGGGYILAPCHNLQPITPTENILAMYEAIA